MRDIGEICRNLVPAMDKITPADIVATAKTLDTKKWSLILSTYGDDLTKALPILAALIEAHRHQ